MSDLWLRATARHEWALVPSQRDVGPPSGADRARLYRRHFRWLRADRTAGLCPPSRAFEQLGWMLRSPVDALLRAIDDIELPRDASEADLRELALAGQVWVRKTTAVFTEGAAWLNYYQFRVEDKWHQMFVPNGEGSLEWHLGFDLDVSDGSHVLVLPAGPHGITVPALMAGTTIREQHAGQGFSIAIRPTGRIRVSRGDIVARVVVLSDDSVGAELLAGVP